MNKLNIRCLKKIKINHKEQKLTLHVPASPQLIRVWIAGIISRVLPFDAIFNLSAILLNDACALLSIKKKKVVNEERKEEEKERRGKRKKKNKVN